MKGGWEDRAFREREQKKERRGRIRANTMNIIRQTFSGVFGRTAVCKGKFSGLRSGSNGRWADDDISGRWME